MEGAGAGPQPAPSAAAEQDPSRTLVHSAHLPTDSISVGGASQSAVLKKRPLIQPLLKALGLVGSLGHMT